MSVNFSVANEALGMSVRFSNAKKSFDTVQKVLPQAVDEFVSRANRKGQFLSWVDLPKEQLKRVDKIYEMVRHFKGQSSAKMLTILGIGGSKHTVEHVLGINGLNLKGDKVKFYSDIDSTSFNRFLQELDGDITNSSFMVASKSGSTFETKDGMLRIIEAFRNKFNPNKRIPNGFIDKGIGNYMIAVTDKNSKSSELRRMSDSQGWLGNLYIHDDVGGRFSALDDHALFALAYAGMKKTDMIKMLESAQKVSDTALKNDKQNIPLLEAAFWAGARLNGIKDSVQLYLGNMFKDTAVWHTQMQNESIKDSSRQISKITDAMHHSSEAWYNPANKYAFGLTAPVDKGAARENVEGYIGAIEKANSASGPSMVELVETSELGLTPEAAGAMTQTKGFATIYQGIIERFAKKEPQPEVLPEVLQPNVEFYKKNLKPSGDSQPPVAAGRISLNA